MDWICETKMFLDNRQRRNSVEDGNDNTRRSAREGKNRPERIAGPRPGKFAPAADQRRLGIP
jgi:hypothetical protein